MEKSKESKQEEFVVTARKWRPLRFDFVVGQEHITHTLQNAIKTNRMHHAFLFSGPRGVGKTTTARILARALNCMNLKDFEPCNECPNCTSILDGNSYDVIEIDGASNNSVDDIRLLRENSKYPPVKGKYKLYIIDEVHMLSTSAFNALLKTLEEPPPHLLFVFATTESHKVPATIISRCQRFDFRRMEIESIVKQLRFISEKEGISIDEESLITIAKKGDGSMRDSQSIFDQVIAFCGKNVNYSEMAESLHLIDEEFFFRISKAVMDKNIQEMFKISQLVMSKGYDLVETLQGLLEHFRNLLTVKVTNSTEMIESSKAMLERYSNTAARFTQADLIRMLNLISQSEQQLKYAPQPRIKFELTLVNLASAATVMNISELVAEIKSIRQNGIKIPVYKEQAQIQSVNIQEDKTFVAKEEPIKYEVIEKPKQEIVKPISQEIKTIEINKLNWANFLSEFNILYPEFNFLSSSATKFEGNKIIIEIEEVFLLNSVKSKYDLILSEATQFFGSKLNLIFEETAKKTVIKNLNNNLNHKSSSYLPRTTKELNLGAMHPVEKAIVELFGAEELID